ncbi:MAG: hypothetical protein KA751_00540 [Comamonas sp.]|nr:hypothetical protein [Comamonas sp.]
MRIVKKTAANSHQLTPIALLTKQASGSYLGALTLLSQYTSNNFKRFCQIHRLTPSMSHKGNCRGGTDIASFFAFRKRHETSNASTTRFPGHRLTA